MNPNAVGWPVRSVVAGTAGTAALTLAYAAERRLRSGGNGRPLDYDDSLVPGQIVASIMHLGKVTDREEHELGMALRWSSARRSGCGTGCCTGGSRTPGRVRSSAGRS